MLAMLVLIYLKSIKVNTGSQPTSGATCSHKLSFFLNANCCPFAETKEIICICNCINSSDNDNNYCNSNTTKPYNGMYHCRYAVRSRMLLFFMTTTAAKTTLLVVVVE